MNFLSILTLLTIFATNPAIEYSGRIDFSNPETPTFSYSGVSIRASIEASAVSVILDDEKGENYFATVVDNVYTGKIKAQKGKNTYPVATFAKKGEHEIEIVRITEEEFGKTSFVGFELDAEGTASQPAPRPYTIEFIGNSITCGYGNEGRIGQRFSASTENHYMTYAAMTARSFNAKTIVAAKSGKGICRNYAGPSTGNPDNMTDYYDRMFFSDAEPKYDFAIQPDVVCINLGTNDMSTPGYDTALFINNYMRLIDQIQTNYKQPDIVCLLGTMLYGLALDTARLCISEVARRANAKGRGRVSFFEMTPQNIKENGLGIDNHPTVKQHILSARQLTEFISQLKGWDVDPQIMMAKLSGESQITLYANCVECLKSGVTGDIVVVADGQPISPLSVTTDEAKATLIITVNRNIAEADKIELRGTAEFQKIMRCEVEKH
jgi:hypothetical protein